MPLQPQFLDVPMTGSLSQKQGRWVVDAPSMLTCDNCEYTKDGEIACRAGVTTQTLAAAEALYVGAPLGGLLVCDGVKLWSSLTSTADTQLRGLAPRALLEQRDATSLGLTHQRSPDAAQSANYTVVAWSENKGVYCSVWDEQRQAWAYRNRLLNSTPAPTDEPLVRVIKSGDGAAIVVAWDEGDPTGAVQGNVRGVRFDVNAGTFGAAVTLLQRALLPMDGYGFDVAPWSATQIAFIGALVDPGGAASGIRWTLHLTSGPTLAVVASGTTGLGAIAPDYAVALATRPGVRMTGAWVDSATGDLYTETLTEAAGVISNLVGPTNTIAGASPTNIGLCYDVATPVFVFDTSAASLVPYVSWAGSLDPATLLPTTGSAAKTVLLSSKPWAVGGRVYVVGGHHVDQPNNNAVAGSTYLFDITAGVYDQAFGALFYDPWPPVGVLNARDASAPRSWQMASPHPPRTLANVQQGNGTAYVVASNKRGNVVGENAIGADELWGLMSAQVNTIHMGVAQTNTSMRRLPVAAIGSQALVGSSCAMVYDGTRTREWNFCHAPDYCAATRKAGGALPDGTYQYAIVYRWTDANGNVVNSEPTFSGEVVVDVGLFPGQQQIDVDVAYIKIGMSPAITPAGSTFLPAFTSIILYRSFNGGTFYRITPTDTLAWGNTWNNTPASADALTYTDSAAPPLPPPAPQEPTHLNEWLYTTGSVLPDVTPPWFSFVCAHKGRFFGLHGPDVWFSKLVVAGSQPGFSDVGQVLTVNEGGDWVAAATLDSVLVLFKRDSVWLLSGEGPNDTGAGFDYQLQKLPSDVGCITPGSVVVTSDGVYFQSKRGISIVTRGMTVEYVGAGVADLATSLWITASVARPENCDVLFFGSNRALAFNWLFKRWSTWTLPTSGATLTSAAMVYTSPLSGTLYTCDDGGRVNAHNANLDNGSWIAQDVSFGWTKLSGLQGYGRAWHVYVLGRKRADVAVATSVYADYGTTAEQTRSWSIADVNAIVKEDNRVQVRVGVKKQMAEAVRARVLAVGGGFTVVGLRIEVGVNQSSFKNFNPATASK